MNKRWALVLGMAGVALAVPELRWSAVKDRSGSAPLEGATVDTEFLVVFTSPDEPGIASMNFYLDQADGVNGALYHREGRAPYDMAGTDQDGNGNPIPVADLSVGPHRTDILVTYADGTEATAHASFSVAARVTPPPTPAPPGFYNLFTSPNADRSNSVSLDSSSVYGNVYITLQPEAGVKTVTFYMDRSSGAPDKVEGLAPYDYRGGEVDQANPFNTADLSDGLHTLRAFVQTTSGNVVEVVALFTVANSVNRLVIGSSIVGFKHTTGSAPPSPKQIDVSSTGSAVAFTVTSDAPWVSITASGTTPTAIEASVVPNGLAAGDYSSIVTVASSGLSAVFEIFLEVVSKCQPVVCSQIRVDVPFSLSFDSDAGHLLDGNGVGTGLRHVFAPNQGTGYVPENLKVNTAKGHLEITTTKGIQFGDNNDADNNVGVGFGPTAVTYVNTTLVSPADVPTTGAFEQAGLYFGYNQDNYVKVVYMHHGATKFVQFAIEVNGEQIEENLATVNVPSGTDLVLELIIDPNQKNVQGRYKIGDQPHVFVYAVHDVPAEFYSFDAAGIDPVIGTRSFAGMFGTHRRGPNPVTYSFSSFSVAEGEAVQVDTQVDFTRKSHNLPSGTSMVFGPDGRLYVTDMFGKIHALTYNDDLEVVDDELITTLVDKEGNRLLLGITIDPASTAQNITLYLSHSSGGVENGVLNSGMVTRLSGANFEKHERVLTGLPRGFGNHGPNSLHFGPDGRLYVAIGGNTGAGSVITGDGGEFGDRPEQVLSAAILVADINKPSFDGHCYKEEDGEDPLYGDKKCDVELYATGLRNSYDFTFHSNGVMYATDNGLGVTGAFPPSPTPGAACRGVSDPKKVAQGGNNPGEQTDLLLKIEEGKYYGHPNPARDECIFKDGSLQGLSESLPNYEGPIGDLGMHASANGLVEYTSDKGCGQLKGSLLYTRFQLGQDVRMVELSEDGQTAVKITTLATGFQVPLTLATNSNGDIFVAEFHGGKITALRVKSRTCGVSRTWSTLEPMPQAALDAGSAVVGNELFAIGGKHGGDHFTTGAAYDTVANTWRSIATKPGSAVENSATVAYGGHVYHFAGSTEAFSGAVTEAYRYDPVADSWTVLAPVPTARGGAVAEVANDRIYVIGGMGADGASVTTVEIYDPATNMWTTGPSLLQPRDNPGGEVVGGKIYIMGGRHRLSNGNEVNGALSSMEVLDTGAAVPAWSTLASMPTGRRTMVTGVLDGLINVIGGEKSPTNGLFRVTERYEPSTDSWTTWAPPPNARHGAAYGVIANKLYVAGGSLQVGSQATDIVESY